MAQHGQGAADEGYELGYRDYLLQRFHRVEAGTVKMTTNQDVDLRELFVMPRVRPRTGEAGTAEGESSAPATLAVARGRLVENLAPRPATRPSTEPDEKNPTVLKWVKENRRAIIVGTPGSGKSTFVEWLQVQLAGGAEVFVLSGRQAIPVLLRIRQLEPRNLPRGSALIEKATARKELADLMPRAWIYRQMTEGRVLLIIDGLDETEPQLRDELVLPWLAALCRQFPKCGYLVTSRPVGYPAGVLREFVEADLLDFDEPQVREYTNHWCTAIRLARNEPDAEARRKGTAEGETIVAGFKGHPYVRDLARNPLMLSAICLVNYFEHGSLPRTGCCSTSSVLRDCCTTGTSGEASPRSSHCRRSCWLVAKWRWRCNGMTGRNTKRIRSRRCSPPR
jgi:energy-coupling factor transporter ATP-binding protein EcfA2